jgi:hypothetical protein
VLESLRVAAGATDWWDKTLSVSFLSFHPPLLLLVPVVLGSTEGARAGKAIYRNIFARKGFSLFSVENDTACLFSLLTHSIQPVVIENSFAEYNGSTW